MEATWGYREYRQFNDIRRAAPTKMTNSVKWWRLGKQTDKQTEILELKNWVGKTATHTVGASATRQEELPTCREFFWDNTFRQRRRQRNSWALGEATEWTNIQWGGTENLTDDIIVINNWNLKKNMHIQVQEAQKTTKGYGVVKLCTRKTDSKAGRKKGQVTH